MIEETILSMITKLAEKGDAISIAVVIPLLLTIFFIVRESKIKQRFSRGACLGSPDNCITKIIKKCMEAYDVQERTVKYGATDGYLHDLQHAIDNGVVVLSEDMFNYTAMKHKKIIDASFLVGKMNIHDLVVADDFPPTYIIVNNVDVLNPAFEELSNKCFESYYNTVWDLYAEAYQQSFYKLSFASRKKAYEKNKPAMKKLFLNLMIEFNKIMGKEKE
jgi:hypothetical protein